MYLVCWLCWKEVDSYQSLHDFFICSRSLPKNKAEIRHWLFPQLDKGDDVSISWRTFMFCFESLSGWYFAYESPRWSGLLYHTILALGLDSTPLTRGAVYQQPLKTESSTIHLTTTVLAPKIQCNITSLRQILYSSTVSSLKERGMRFSWGPGQGWVSSFLRMEDCIHGHNYSSHVIWGIMLHLGIIRRTTKVYKGSIFQPLKKYPSLYQFRNTFRKELKFHNSILILSMRVLPRPIHLSRHELTILQKET